jgi:hypothetical protein
MRTSVQLAPALAACAASEAEWRSHARRAGMAVAGHCLSEGAIVASVPIDHPAVPSGSCAVVEQLRAESVMRPPANDQAASCDSLAASVGPAQVPAR